VGTRLHKTIRLNAIRRVAGKADPKPRGEMATKNTIPPMTPKTNIGFRIKRKIPERICPEAMRVMNRVAFWLKIPSIKFLYMGRTAIGPYVSAYTSGDTKA